MKAIGLWPAPVRAARAPGVETSLPSRNFGLLISIIWLVQGGVCPPNVQAHLFWTGHQRHQEVGMYIVSWVALRSPATAGEGWQSADPRPFFVVEMILLKAPNRAARIE